jgi:GNAT superfamily N-acetyltransferase
MDIEKSVEAKELKMRIQSFTPEWQEKTEDCIRDIIRTQRNDSTAEAKPRYKDIAKNCQRVPEEDFKIAIDENTGMVTGTIGLRFLRNGVGQLIRFGVRPAFEGKGIGSQLFNDLMDFAKTNQYKKIYLTTEADDGHAKARGVYERRDFTRTNLGDMPKEDLDLILAGDDNIKHIEEGKTLIYKLQLEQKGN